MTVATKASNSLAETVTATQAALREAGTNGRATFTADTQLVSGYQTTARIRNFKLVIDEPTSLGGTDLGPNPVEVVLAALGTCQEIVYATYAALLGVELEQLSIRVTGTLDPRGSFNVADVPAGFDDVQFEVQLVSPNPPEQIRQLVDLVQQHCPVLDILQRPLPVRGSVALNGAPFSVDASVQA